MNPFSHFDLSDASELAELPVWNAKALAAIASAFLRRGDLVTGRRLLQQVERQAIDEKAFWSRLYQAHRDQPWAIAIAAQAEAGDIEGAVVTAEKRLEASAQSLGLILVGEAQAEAGDKEGAWQTFLLAVAISGEPEALMDATSLSDIGLGASQTGKVAAATLIAERLNLAWLSKAIEAAQPNKYVHWYEEDPVRQLRSFYGLRSDVSYRALVRRYKGAESLTAAALYCRECGNHNEAKEMLGRAKKAAQKVRDLNPRSHRWTTIVDYHLSADEWAEAIDAADHVPEPFVRGYTFLRIIKVQLWKKNLTAAIATATHAEKSVELPEGSSPSFVEFWLTMASALMESGQESGVMAYFNQAWRVAQGTRAGWPESNQKALSDVIAAMAKAGYVDAAIRHYNKAASAKPETN